MKRTYAILAAVMLVIGVAGQASAALFYGGILGTNTEMGMELGDTTTGSDVMVEVSMTNLFDANDIGATFSGDTSLENLTVGGLSYLFTDGGRGNDDIYETWFAIEAGATVDAISEPNMPTVYAYYNGVSNESWTDGTYTDTAAAESMAGLLNGTYAGIVNPAGIGSVSLVDLTVDNDVVMDIWYFNNNQTQEDYSDDTLAATNYQLIYSLDTDGSVSASVSAVPVPGALVLLGSGLLALVGVRRKKA